MTTNIDLLTGGDAHKRFDVRPGPGETLLQRVLVLNDVEAVGAQRAAQRALALPSANGMPADLRKALTRIAEGPGKPKEDRAAYWRTVAMRSRNAD